MGEISTRLRDAMARRKAQKYTKEGLLQYWAAKLRRRINPLKFMVPIPYKASGSKYGCCGIRIDGSPEFIDAVLSQLTDLMDGENAYTRLELARNPVEAVTIKGETKGFENAVFEAECCYIRLHQRGGEAQMVNGMFGVAKEATERYVALVG